MIPHYVTHFDGAYAARGLAMLRSLRAVCPEAPITVQPLDTDAEAILVDAVDGSVEVIQHDRFLARSWRNRRLRRRRSAWEYYATQKPMLVEEVLRTRVPPDGWVAWIDADTWWYADPTSAYRELVDASVGLSPHRFHAETSRGLRYGVFNAGFALWRQDAIGRACVASWVEACRRWCHAKVRDGRFMNQGYLNDWPARFERVHVLGHPGLNLAPWNVGSHDVAWSGEAVTVDGRPLVFFHFSGLVRDEDGSWGTAYATRAMRTGVVGEALYAPYIRELEAVGAVLEDGFGTSGLGMVRRDGRPAAWLDLTPAASAKTNEAPDAGGSGGFV